MRTAEYLPSPTMLPGVGLLESAALRADTRAAERPAPEHVTVLVATARNSLVRAFQRAALVIGLTLAVSPDGLHTLMTAVREPPGLIILDSDVPGVDADTVERMLARDERTAGVPVVRLPNRAPDDGNTAADGLLA